MKHWIHRPIQLTGADYDLVYDHQNGGNNKVRVKLPAKQCHHDPNDPDITPQEAEKIAKEIEKTLNSNT